jgi:hypothetical protein
MGESYTKRKRRVDERERLRVEDKRRGDITDT